VGDKFSVEIDAPHETFEVMCAGGCWPLLQILHPRGIWVHTLGIHYEPQVLDESLVQVRTSFLSPATYARATIQALCTHVANGLSKSY
jgi:hypothetical protein